MPPKRPNVKKGGRTSIKAATRLRNLQVGENLFRDPVGNKVTVTVEKGKRPRFRSQLAIRKEAEEGYE